MADAKLTALAKQVTTAGAKVEQADASHKTEVAKHELALASLASVKGAFDAEPSDANADLVVKATAEASKIELFVGRTSKLLDEARASLAQAERERDEHELGLVSAVADQEVIYRELEKLVATKADVIREAALVLHAGATKLAEDGQKARRRKLELQKALKAPGIERTEAELRAEARNNSALDFLPRVLRLQLNSEGTDPAKLKWLAFL